MHMIAALIIITCLYSGFYQINPIPENEIAIDYAIDLGKTNYLYERTNSLKNIQSRNITTQNYDYSCGSAALATLLNFYLGEHLTEFQVIQGLMEYGNKTKISERRAFSLLDMKEFVNKLGYRGVGYKAQFSDLLELDQPLLLPIEKEQYRHFIVFKGVYNGHVFVADPFAGNTNYTIARFQEIWYNNIIFVVYPEGAKEYNLLRISADDLRYIDEDSVLDIIDIYQPEFYDRDGGKDFFTLPDEYQKYHPW